MKKKILMLAVAACLIVLSIASSSLAYFTDTAAETKVFTSGNVDITLAYTAEDAGNRYPGMSYDDNAIITVANNSETAYIGAIITFKGGVDISNLAFTSDTTNVTKKVIDGAIYVVFEDDVAKNGTVNVFNEMTIPATWDTEEMKKLNEGITVTAYAVQAVGFDNATEALKAAFGGENGDWSAYPAPVVTP